VLLVGVEPPWPAHHGGRLRTARVAEGLGRELDVLVAFPDHGPRAEDPPVPCRPLSWAPRSALRSRISGRPHLGGHYLRPTIDQLVRLAEQFRPDAIYWSHSYLAAWAPRPWRSRLQVVEFANLEGRRLRTLIPAAAGLQRAARTVEAAKAWIWEPRVARAASLCVALSEPDRAALAAWGGRAVLAGNGVDEVAYEPSPPDGYALAMASYDYQPNVLAVRALVRDVWPLVRGALPAARLIVAGRGSEALRAELTAVDGVSVLGTVPEVTAAYAGAAVALAPARTGGGSQLKLTEALSRGRCLVASPFAAGGLPEPLRDCDAYRVKDGPDQYAEAIVEAMSRVEERHRRERSGWQQCQPLRWSRTADTLITAITGLTARSVAP
jgi:hypothetical protein